MNEQEVAWLAGLKETHQAAVNENVRLMRELAEVKLALQKSNDDMGGGTVAEVVARVVKERDTALARAEKAERALAAADVEASRLARQSADNRKERDTALAKLAEAEAEANDRTTLDKSSLEHIVDEQAFHLVSAKHTVQAADALIRLLVQGEVLAPVYQRELDKWKALRARSDWRAYDSSGSAEQSGVAQREQSNEGTHGPLDRPAPEPAGSSPCSPWCSRCRGGGAKCPDPHCLPCQDWRERENARRFSESLAAHFNENTTFRDERDGKVKTVGEVAEGIFEDWQKVPSSLSNDIDNDHDCRAWANDVRAIEEQLTAVKAALMPTTATFQEFDDMRRRSPAEAIRRLVHERDALNAQVTALQTRCTELLEERRRANVDYAVREFHLAMGIPAPAEFAVPPDDRVRLRARLVAEEFLELLGSMLGTPRERPWYFPDVRERLFWLIEHAPVEVDLAEWARETHDLDYVVAGTRVEFGYRGIPGAAEVHAANMRKVGGEVREDGKVLKPEGWVEPDMERVLREQGYRR